MRGGVKAFAYISLVLMALVSYRGDFIETKGILTVGLFTVFIGYALWKKFHWSVGLAYTGVALRAAFTYLIEGPHNPDPLTSAYLVKLSQSYYMSLTCVGVFFLIVTEKLMYDMRKALGVIAVMASILGIFGHQCLGNPSMTGCLIAITVPFIECLHIRKRYIVGGWVLATLAVLMTKSTLPIIALSSVLAIKCYLVMYQETKAFTFVILGGCAMWVFFLGRHFMPDFTSDSGRYGAWRLMWDIVSQGHWKFGIGAGVTRILLPMLQMAQGINNKAGEVINFLWLHNDLYQIFVECGLLVILVGIMCVQCVYKSLRRPQVLMSMSAFGVTLLFNYPLQIPITAFIGAYLVAASFPRKHRKYEG